MQQLQNLPSGGKAIAEQGPGSETRNTSETAGLGTSYSRIQRGIQTTWPRPWGRKNIVYHKTNWHIGHIRQNDFWSNMNI